MFAQIRSQRFKWWGVIFMAGLLAALVVRALPARATPLKSLTGSTVTAINPGPVSSGTFDITFSVAAASPDGEFMERFDIDLPNSWTVNSVTNLPSNTVNPCDYVTTQGVESGNVVYWQNSEYPLETKCVTTQPVSAD
jgi:hypothetical protein